jgi:hypothetical protein
VKVDVKVKVGVEMGVKVKVGVEMGVKVDVEVDVDVILPLVFVNYHLLYFVLCLKFLVNYH